MASRGNRLTKSDMDAARLVFVYVKDAKPKRKVAVPVPDGYAWSEFLHQVKSKLRITGVSAVYLASSGQKVVSLEDLQDIDELCVVEGPEATSGRDASPASAEAALRSGSAASSSDIKSPNGAVRQQSLKPERFKVTVGAGDQASADDQGKYRARVNPLKRALQQLLPSVFAPTLPVTSRDTDEGRGLEASRVARRRKGRRSILQLRNVLLILAVLSCVGTMAFFMLKSPKLAA